MEKLGSKHHKESELTRDDFDGGPISLDNIDSKLYLGIKKMPSNLQINFNIFVSKATYQLL